MKTSIDTTPGKPAVLNSLLFGLVYFAAAELGHVFSMSNDFTTFWPPSGIYVAALLIANRRSRSGLIVAALFAGLASEVLMHHHSVSTGLGFCLADAVTAVVGAYLSRRLARSPFNLHHLGSLVGLFITAVLLGPMLGAFVGATVSATNSGAAFWPTWLMWFLSAAIGVIAFAPLTLTLLCDRASLREWLRPRLLGEGLLLLAGLVAASETIVGYLSSPLIWTFLPFMLWAAFRFGVGGVSLVVMVLTMLLVGNTAVGRGPFAGNYSILEQLLLVRSFLAIIAFSFLSVAVILEERRRVTLQWMQAEERWRALFDHMEEQVFSTDPEGRFIQVNRSFRETLGYTEEELLSLTIFDVVPESDKSGCRSELLDQLTGEKVRIRHGRIMTKHGQILDVEGTSEMHFEKGLPIYSLSIFRDVTTRNKSARQLEEYQLRLEEANDHLELLATTDCLTQLKNRRVFQEKLSEEVQRVERSASPLSLLILDVDHFKSFNDCYGHPAGDDVLRSVAALLRKTARATDLVARYGGEEFVILLPDTDRHGATTLAERFRQAIAEAEWPNRSITISVGASTLSLPDHDGVNLLRQADAALYLSKRTGRNRVHHAEQLAFTAPES